MVNYLTKSEISASEAEVRAEFERLLGHGVFASDPNAKQWQFFRHCFNVLIGDPFDHFRYEEEEIRHYKSEVSKRLDWYYLELLDRMDRKIAYSFRLEHIRRKHKFMAASADYPVCKQYLLLVSPFVVSEIKRQERRSILLRAVADAVTAEFTAYRKLPDINPRMLEEFFDAAGPAYQHICKTIQRHQENGEIISNDDNPSRKLLLDGEVIYEDEENAKMRTVEDWYLRWWSAASGSYSPKVSKGRKRQIYTLVKRGSRWLVWDNTCGRPRGTLL